MAAKFNVPVIPCLYTFEDSELIGKDGLPVQELTLHVAPMIIPDPNLSTNENTEIMMKQNTQLWKEIYEKTYGIPLEYL